MTYHSITPVHIVAGKLALVFGYIALFSKKGAALHRKTGMYFVYAMVTMSLTGAFMAVFKPTPANIAAGLLTFYFVMTRHLSSGARPVGCRTSSTFPRYCQFRC